MSAMAASSSKSSALRQPHNIPLPPSPEKFSSHHTSSKKRKKGKDKEHDGDAPLPPRVEPTLEGDWNHAKAGTNDWQWTSLTDSSASKHRPVFTKDGSYFFAIVGSSIKIHSCATGQVVSTLSDSSARFRSAGQRDHSDVITSAILSPNNAFQLITGSLNGYIQIWDFLDAVLLQTIDIEQPIFHLCAHQKFPNHVFVAIAKSTQKKNRKGHEKEENGVVLRVSLKPQNATIRSKIQKSSDISQIGKTRAVVGLAFSPSGSWLVAVAGHKAYVAVTASFHKGFTKYVSPEALTCLAFHPSEDYFATGDDKGNIRLWYCLNEQVAASAVGVEKRAQTTTLHWHAHAIAAIAFTANGAYLLSGGEESVLVIWQLHTGKKEFVPRVGAPISAIAVNQVGQIEEYLLGLADATFIFISAASLKIARSYSRIKLDPETVYGGLPASSPLAVHSVTSTLILPSSHPSSLQTYAPSTSTLISELEVSPSNRISRRDEAPMEPSCVEHVTVSSSGEWMATIDGRGGDEAFRGEVHLKIWQWNPETGSWILNTRINRPHGLQRVTSIAFSPEIRDRQALQLVTTGDDLNVKIWRLRTRTDKNGELEESWVTRSSFGFRGERPTHACWSPDCSLMCISLGPHVALYDSVSNALRRILTSPDCKTVCSARFVGRSGRYLVAASIWDVVLWDLPAQSVRWHNKSPWPIDSIVTHPRDDTFALLHCPSVSPRSRRHTTPISIFHSSSSIPSRKHTVPFGFLNVAWYPPSSSSNTSSFTLVGITNKYSVVLFGDNTAVPVDESSTAKAIVGGTILKERKTLFQDIFGISAFTGLTNVSSIVDSPSLTTTNSLPGSGNDVAGLLDMPAYLMPPIETLFNPLMDSFLKLRSEEENKCSIEEIKHQDEDVDMAGQSRDDFIVIETRQERLVDQNEMGMFIELFRQIKVSPNHKVNALSAMTFDANGTVLPIASSSRPKVKCTGPSQAALAMDTSIPSITPSFKKSKKRRRASQGP